jgi:hypothetical protein
MTSKGKPKKLKKMGRPLDDPEQGQRGPTIGFRPWVPMYKRLQDSAAAAGWSMSAEIERRLEQSFSDDANLKSLLAYGKGASETLRLLRLILATINAVEVQENTDANKPGMLDVKLWHEDPKRAQELFDTLIALERAVLVDGIRPLEDVDDYKRELSAAASGAASRTRAEFKAWRVLLGAGFVSRAPQQSVADVKAELRSKIDELHQRLEYIESVEQTDEWDLQTVYFEAHNDQNDVAGRKSEAQGSARDPEAQTREKTS